MNLLPLLLPMLSLSAQPDLRALSLESLADRCVVDGIIESAFQFKAGTTTSTLLLSRTGIFASGNKEADLRSSRLYATLFTEQADGGVQQWRVQDGVDDCPVDITLQFTDPPAVVSDADGDSVPEIWVGYRTACRGDVSPATLKIIGYEGEQKYALRGTERVQLGDSSEGGDYEADAALKSAPKLLEYASGLWAKVRDTSF